jgi:peptide/nickel transport system permease protein
MTALQERGEQQEQKSDPMRALYGQKVRSRRFDFLRAIAKTYPGRIGSAVILLIILLAIFAPMIAPSDPYAIDPVNRLQPPSTSNFFGTDETGRDVFSRVIFGSRISLQVGLIAVSISMSLGVIFGVTAGFYGGVVDQVIMRFIDVLLAFPGFLLALAIIAMLGPSLTNAMIAVGIGSAPGFARLVRSVVLSIRNTDYVMAARVVGASNFHIMRHQVLRNVLAPVIVLATLEFPLAILIAANLSFLGLGAQPPTPEWGAMVVSARTFIRSEPWLINFPGLAIFITVLGFNLFGNAVRDALDPRLRRG